MEISSLGSGVNLKEIAGIKTKANNDKGSFSNLLSDSIKKVNDLQHQANQAQTDFALGETEDIHDVMIATQKASLSVDMAATVTNKAVSAYEEIMRMQV